MGALLMEECRNGTAFSLPSSATLPTKQELLSVL